MTRGTNPAPGTPRSPQLPGTPHLPPRPPRNPQNPPKKSPGARLCPARGLVPLEGAESCAAPRPCLSMVSGVGFLLDFFFFSSSSFPSSSSSSCPAPRVSFARGALRAGGTKGRMQRIPAGMR